MSTERLAIVLADGELDAERLADLAKAAAPESGWPRIIAADGAAGKALAAGVRPDLVIGDGDSLEPSDRTKLEELGVDMRFADPDKDESDTELCLLTALDLGATRITVLGALGGDRPEHGVANLLLLGDPRFDGHDVEIVAGAARMARIGSGDGPGELTITGAPGDYVSLFAIGGPVEGVRTVGLRFHLDGERLALGPSRGLSNELLAERAEITTATGALLVVHTARNTDTGGR